VRGRGFEPPRP